MICAVVGVNMYLVNNTASIVDNSLKLDDVEMVASAQESTEPGGGGGGFTYYHYNGKYFKKGGWFTNWAQVYVWETCTDTMLWPFNTSAGTYQVYHKKCCYGDGDCWLDDVC